MQLYTSSYLVNFNFSGKTCDLWSNERFHVQTVVMWISHKPCSSSVTMTTEDRKANKQRFEVKTHYWCECRITPRLVRCSPWGVWNSAAWEYVHSSVRSFKVGPLQTLSEGLNCRYRITATQRLGKNTKKAIKALEAPVVCRLHIHQSLYKDRRLISLSSVYPLAVLVLL